MDYIIFGLGVGATLTLVGWSFRVWGPALRDRASSAEETVLSGYELVNRMAWQRFCRSCGAVLAMFGLLVLAVTTIATILTLPNNTGTTIVLATFVVCLVATLVWLGLFLHRFGSRGIFRPPIVQPDSVPAAASGEHVSPASVSGQSDAPVSRGGPSVAVASEGRPDVAGTPIDTANAGAPPAFEPSDGGLATSDEPYGETDDGTDAAVGERDPEHEDALVLEEEHEEGEETNADAGDDVDHASLESPERVEGPEEEEAATGRLIVRSAAGDERPPVALSADSGIGTDPRRDEEPETDAVASEDLAAAAPETGMPDDVVAGQSPGADIDAEREPTVVQTDPEVPASSGRAEAVRSLRQRRIRRLMQDPPESE